MTSALERFAVERGLRLAREVPRGPWIIPATYGHVYDWEDGRRLAVLVFGPRVTRKRWGNRRRALEAAGCVTVQRGDDEGAVTFDPGDGRQVRAVLRAVRPHRRRRGTGGTPPGRRSIQPRTDDRPRDGEEHPSA